MLHGSRSNRSTGVIAVCRAKRWTDLRRLTNAFRVALRAGSSANATERTMRGEIRTRKLFVTAGIGVESARARTEHGATRAERLLMLLIELASAGDNHN